MRKAKLTFFKQSGKYYDELEREYPKEFEMWDIADSIKEEERAYQNMHIVVTFDENDDKGYPMLIFAHERAIPE